MADRILIVDDDSDIRNLCTDALSNEDYQVVTSASGEEAFDLAQQQDFAVVLSDIRMPGMNGLELLDSLKKHNPDQTIIMFSGFGDVDVAVEAMKKGAFDYLAKPLILDELKITIRMAMQQNHLRLENQKLKKELQESLTSLGDAAPAIPLLQNIPADSLKEFLDLGEMRTYNPPEVLLQESSSNKHLFLIFEGEISVWQEGAELFRLGKFDCYGEMNIFKPNLSTQSLIAETTSKVLIIERETIFEFFNRKEEKLFKYFILNTLNSTYLKLRRTSSRVNQLERLLKE